MSEYTIRSATPDDAAAIFQLVYALAEYEKLAEEVVSTPADFRKILASPSPSIEILLAEKEATAIGFALFFENYSTFLGKPGFFLEDLFVLPDHRKSGIGTALLRHILGMAKERSYGRVDWNVLDWNEPAINFYTNTIGAKLLPAWRLCRVVID